MQEFGLQGIVWNEEIAKGAPVFSFTNFEQIGATDLYQDPSERIYQITNNLTWTRSNHTIKAGINFAFNRGTNFPGGTSFPVLQFGQFGFSGTFSGFDYADFLLGIPQTAGRANAIPLQDTVNRDFTVFVQDDWKVTRRLTLNLGVRYEYNPPYHDNQFLLFNFDPATGSVVVPNEQALQQINPLFPRNLVPVVTASQAGVAGKSLLHRPEQSGASLRLCLPPFRQCSHGDPRRLRNLHRRSHLATLAVRIGRSVRFVRILHKSDHQRRCPSFSSPVPFPAGFGAIGAQNFNALDPHFRNPYIQQWSLTLEQEVPNTGIRVSYIGTNSRELPWIRNINQPVPGTVPSTTTSGNSLNCRTSCCVKTAACITTIRCMPRPSASFAAASIIRLAGPGRSALTDCQNDSEQGCAVENSYARDREYANVNYQSRHRLVGTLLWDFLLDAAAGSRPV